MTILSVPCATPSPPGRYRRWITNWHETGLPCMLASTLASDLPWIMEPGYYDAYRRGEMPAVQSPFWLNLLSQEKDFKDTQRDFRTLAKAEVSRLLGKKEPSEDEMTGRWQRQ